MRRTLILMALTAVAVGTLPAAANAAPPPPRDEWFAENDTGHWSKGTRVRVDEACLDLPQEDQLACSLDAFQKKPFVVIAFVDSGINPYHEDFRAPEFAHHPSTYIEGFPQDAESLDLSFDVADSQGYDAARNADDPAVWSQARTRRLYWIPGTRIIGGYTTSGCASNCGSNPDHPERVVIDDGGHGTGVASVAAGRYFGSNPNALIVMVEGLGDANLNWATSQPWIDIVSNSWGFIGNVPFPSSNRTREATRRGQTVAFAAGNGATNTNSSTAWGPIGDATGEEDPCQCKTPDSNPSMTSPYGGPSWILTVGAASPINGQAHWWHSIPVDVASFGSKWRAAGAFGVARDQNRDFGGTSNATPTTSGALSAIIERARIQLDDPVAGQRPDQVVAEAGSGAVIPASGPLSDGTLTRLEAEALVQKTAFPVPADAEKLTWDFAVRPTTGTPYDHAIQGYGVVERGSKALALDVLLGEKPMPDRSDVDAFIAGIDTLRNGVWGNP